MVTDGRRGGSVLRRVSATAVLVAVGLVAGLLVSPAPAASAPAVGEARSLDGACPSELVPDLAFTDVDKDDVHAPAIGCLAWWGIVRGTGDGRFDPSATLRRDQLASFVHRMLVAANAPFPSDPPDAFSDDDGVHEPAIDALASIGVTRGHPDGTFHPSEPITRGQLASLIVRALGWLRGEPLPAGPDAFSDDDGSVHEGALDAAAAARILMGLAGGPAALGTANLSAERDPSRRDQVASVVARGLDLLVDEGLAEPPGDPGDPAGPGSPVTGPGGPPIPPDPEEPTAPKGSWMFRPGSLVVAPGDPQVEVALTYVGPTGAVVPTAMPTGTTFRIAGDDSIEIDELDDGVTVRPGDALGAAVVIADIPGQEDDPVLSVTVATLQPGVVPLADDRVLFPPVGLPADIDAPSADLPGYESTGVGPFTWAELASRTILPTTDPGDPAAGLAPEGQIAVVLGDEDAPAVGTIVLGVGGSNVAGRVVEVIVRDGYALIVVAFVPLDEIYDELHYDPCGVLEAGGDPADDCLAPEVDPPPPPTVPPFDETTKTASSKAALAKSALVKADPGPLDEEPLCSKGSSDGVSGGVFTDLKLLNATPQYHPFVHTGAIVSGGELQTLRFAFGFDASITGGFSGKLQPTVELTTACALFDPKAKDIPVPGPLAPVLSLTMDPSLLLEVQVKIEGGPKLEFGYACSMSIHVRVGFHYTSTNGMSVIDDFDRPPPECNPVWKVSGADAGDAGVAMVAEANVAVNARVKFGGRIGGKSAAAAADFFGELLGEDYANFGKVDLLEVKLGPRVHLVWENTGQVLVNEAAGSVVSIELVVSAAVGLPPIEWMINKMLKASVSLSITLFEGVVPIIGFYRASVPSSMQVVVNGEPQDGVAIVEVDDEVELRVDFGYGPIPIEPASDAGVERGTAWLIGAGGVGDATRFGLFDSFDVLAGGTALESSRPGTVTEDICDEIDGTAPSTVAITAETLMFGIAPTTGYGGTFQIRCENGAVDFADDEVEAGAGTKLVTSGTTQVEWKIPAGGGVRAVPSSGTFNPSEDDEEIAISFVDTRLEPPCPPDEEPPCEPEPPGPCEAPPGSPGFPEAEATLTVDAGARGKDTIVVHLKEIEPVEPGEPPDCDPPPPCDDPPCDPPPPPCDDPPCDPPPPPPPPPCDGCTPPTPPGPCVGCGPGGAWGDPHMITFGNQRFDAQVLGDYVYLADTTGAPDGTELQVRHELTKDTGLFGGFPTSVTAVALRAGEHVIEVYSRPSLQIRVDGAVVTLTSGVPLQVAHDVTLVRTGSNVTVETDDVHLEVSRSTQVAVYLNVDVSTDGPQPLRGLIGSPNNVIGDDLMASDGTTFALAELHGHTDELYALTDSWRVTDLSDSLFSATYDGFDDANPPYSDEGLEPYRAQVLGLFDDLAKICTGDNSHTVDVLAVELAIAGDDADLGDLAQYACTYQVSGRALATLAGIEQPTSGVEITLDAVGLAPCVTTTSASGWYRCSLTPDLAELEALVGPAPLPLAIDITGRWADGTAATLPGSASYSGHAALDSTSRRTVDVAVDPATLPQVDVSGTMTGGDGVPLGGPVPMRIQAIDAAGAVLANLRAGVTPDPEAGGAYRVIRALPRGTVRVVLAAEIGRSALDTVSTQATGLVAGPNAITFDVVYDAPLLEVSGVATGHDRVPLEGPLKLRVRAWNAAGTGVHSSLISAPVDEHGRYRIDLVLPTPAVRATVTAEIGLVPGDHHVLDLPALTPGVNAAVLDVSHDPPVIEVTGTMTGNGGQPLAEELNIRFVSYGPTGAQLHQRRVDDVVANPDGSYALAFPVPVATTRVLVQAEPAGGHTYYQSVDVTPLVPGPNQAVLDVTYDPVIVTVGGRISGPDGNRVAGSVLVNLLSYKVDREDWSLSSSFYAALQPDGTFVHTVVLPYGIVRVVATAHLGMVPADYASVEAQVGPGPNTMSLVTVYDPPVLVLTGHVFDADGVAPPRIGIDVASHDGDGPQLLTDYTLVTIAADGTYRLELPLPKATTRIIVTVRIGPKPYPSTTFTGLTTGENAHTFEVGTPP